MLFRSLYQQKERCNGRCWKDAVQEPQKPFPIVPHPASEGAQSVPKAPGKGRLRLPAPSAMDYPPDIRAEFYQMIESVENALSPAGHPLAEPQGEKIQPAGESAPEAQAAQRAQGQPPEGKPEQAHPPEQPDSRPDKRPVRR